MTLHGNEFCWHRIKNLKIIVWIIERGNGLFHVIWIKQGEKNVVLPHGSRFPLKDWWYSNSIRWILFLLYSWAHCICMLSYFSRVWLFFNVMNCDLPGSSVHGTLQARIVDCVAIPFSRGSSWPGDQTLHCRQILDSWATREAI